MEQDKRDALRREGIKHEERRIANNNNKKRTNDSDNKQAVIPIKKVKPAIQFPFVGAKVKHLPTNKSARIVKIEDNGNISINYTKVKPVGDNRDSDSESDQPKKIISVQKDTLEFDGAATFMTITENIFDPEILAKQDPWLKSIQIGWEVGYIDKTRDMSDISTMLDLYGTVEKIDAINGIYSLKIQKKCSAAGCVILHGSMKGDIKDEIRDVAARDLCPLIGMKICYLTDNDVKFIDAFNFEKQKWCVIWQTNRHEILADREKYGYFRPGGTKVYNTESTGFQGAYWKKGMKVYYRSFMITKEDEEYTISDEETENFLTDDNRWCMGTVGHFLFLDKQWWSYITELGRYICEEALLPSIDGNFNWLNYGKQVLYLDMNMRWCEGKLTNVDYDNEEEWSHPEFIIDNITQDNDDYGEPIVRISPLGTQYLAGKKYDRNSYLEFIQKDVLVGILSDNNTIIQDSIVSVTSTHVTLRDNKIGWMNRNLLVPLEFIGYKVGCLIDGVLENYPYWSQMRIKSWDAKGMIDENGVRIEAVAPAFTFTPPVKCENCFTCANWYW